MAKLVERFICPVCKRHSTNEPEALKCRNSHAVIKEVWAVSEQYKEPWKNKACNVAHYGEERALFEADLPDDIAKRKQKIAELIDTDPEKCRRLGYTQKS